MGIDGLAVRVRWQKQSGILKVERIQVRVIEETDHSAPRACNAVGVLGGKIRDGLLDHHGGVRGAGYCWFEAVWGCADERSISRGWVRKGRTAVRSLGEGAEVVVEDDHDALNLLPVDAVAAVVEERTPVVEYIVAAEVVDTGAGVRMYGKSGVVRIGRFEIRFGGHAVHDVQFGAELAGRKGLSRFVGIGAGFLEERGTAEEGVDIHLVVKCGGKEGDIDRFVEINGGSAEEVDGCSGNIG